MPQNRIANTPLPARKSGPYRFRRSTGARAISRRVLPILLVPLSGCSGVQSALAPAGEEAAAIYQLLLVMVVGGALVWFAVVGLLLHAARRREASWTDEQAGRLILFGGVAFPVAVLLALLVYAVWLMPVNRGTCSTPRIASDTAEPDVCRRSCLAARQPICRHRQSQIHAGKDRPVLHRSTVYLRDQSARRREPHTVEAGAIADAHRFARRLARLGAAPAADMKAQLTGERDQSAFQGAENTGRDARRMPIHSHDGAKGLEPERIGHSRRRPIRRPLPHSAASSARSVHARNRKSISRLGFRRSRRTSNRRDVFV